MQITRSSIETQKGPRRPVHRRRLHRRDCRPGRTSTFAAANVHFTSGARTAWHTHHAKARPSRSSVPATASSSSRGSHWHGAAPDRFMVHIAMQQNDSTGNPVAWGRHVSDEEYNAGPAT